MSISRSIAALRYSSLFGVLCSIYMVLAVTFVFWLNRTIVPDPIQNFRDAKLVDFSFDGIVNTVPLIIFAYMYQVNIPSIYLELTKRNYNTMSTVVTYGTSLSVLTYVVVGIFGYVTFVHDPDVLNDKNILTAPYGNNIPMLIVRTLDL